MNSDFFELLENAGIAAFIKDANGVYVGINKSGAAMVDRSVEKTIGLTDYDLFDTASAQFIRTRDLAIQNSRRGQRFECVVQTKSRWQRFIDAKVAVTDSATYHNYLIGLAADISHERVAQLEDLVRQGFALMQADPAEFCRTFFMWADGFVELPRAVAQTAIA